MANPDAMLMRSTQAPAEFQFTQGHMVDHPQYGTSVLWNNRFLHLVLPLGGEQIRFDLRAFPVDMWVRLQDASGSTFPVAICVDPRGAVMGRWLL